MGFPMGQCNCANGMEVYSEFGESVPATNPVRAADSIRAKYLLIKGKLFPEYDGQPDYGITITKEATRDLQVSFYWYIRVPSRFIKRMD